MSNASEQIDLRNKLQTWLTPHEIRGIGWTALLNASAHAIARGWTGDEIARWILGDLQGNPPDSIGAVAMSRIRNLADTDPPRDATPSPPDIAALRAERAQAVANAEHVDHAAWIARIKNQHDPRLGAGYGDAGMPLPGATAGPGATQPPEPNSGTTPTKSDAQRAAQSRSRK